MIRPGIGGGGGVLGMGFQIKGVPEMGFKAGLVREGV